MRIQVVSDLHLEFHNLLPPVVEDADVLVCAGDLAPIGTGAVRHAAEEWAEARHILYVPGNHEYYGTDIDRGRTQLAEECYSLGITLLDPDAVVIDNVHFIGATLWTDFLLDGLAQEPGAHRAALGVSDFDGWIRHKQRHNCGGDHPSCTDTALHRAAVPRQRLEPRLRLEPRTNHRAVPAGAVDSRPHAQ